MSFVCYYSARLLANLLAILINLDEIYYIY